MGCEVGLAHLKLDKPDMGKHRCRTLQNLEFVAFHIQLQQVYSVNMVFFAKNVLSRQFHFLGIIDRTAKIGKSFFTVVQDRFRIGVLDGLSPVFSIKRATGSG